MAAIFFFFIKRNLVMGLHRYWYWSSCVRLGLLFASIPYFYFIGFPYDFGLSCWPYAGLYFMPVSNGLCVLYPQLAKSSSSLS